jgi:hypothetical protein
MFFDWFGIFCHCCCRFPFFLIWTIGNKTSLDFTITLTLKPPST